VCPQLLVVEQLILHLSYLFHPLENSSAICKALEFWVEGQKIIRKRDILKAFRGKGGTVNITPNSNVE